MRRRAFPFIAPARVRPETVVGIVVAIDDGVSADLPTIEVSTQVVAGHLRVLGLEVVPVEKPRRRWWRRKRTEEVHHE